MKQLWRCLLLLSAILISSIASAQNNLRVGALEYGTVNWELDVIRQHLLARRHGVALEIVPLAGKEAAAVALKSGAVDVVVSDWLWVSRQRHAGSDLTFVPHSLATGALMVAPGAGISDIEDLAGRRIGIAGGPEDKSWLLLRAYAAQESGIDLAAESEPAFGAPPLLNELAKRGELPAVLNYWHYNARLAASGMHTLVDVKDIFPVLGIPQTPPLLGWVFSETFAKKNPEALRGFLDASQDAKRVLANSDDEWQRLRPLMHAANDEEFEALRDAYRDGIPGSYSPADALAAQRAYEVMAEVAGEVLTNGESRLAAGTFWDGIRF